MKCQRVAQWHTPGKEVGSDALQLARVGQLPQLLTQQKEEGRRLEEELERLRQQHDEKLITRHKVSKVSVKHVFCALSAVSGVCM